MNLNLLLKNIADSLASIKLQRLQLMVRALKLINHITNTNMKRKIFLISIYVLTVISPLFATDDINWGQKGYFGGGAISGTTSFTVNNYAYVCLGKTGTIVSQYKRTTYRYDPLYDVWKRMADLPTNAQARSYAAGFSINGKGYIFGGDYESLVHYYYPIDVWEYNPSTNLWYQRADFPRPGGISSGIGFSIGSYGYAGLGFEGYNNIDDSYGEKNDFYRFDPSKNNWVRLSDFPGAPRQDAVGFSMNDRGYVGLGYSYDSSTGYTYYNDFWEYNPEDDSWTRLPDFPGQGRQSPIGYGINACCYVGLGKINDFYKYDTSTKEWTSLNYLPGSARYAPISFSINSNIYYGCGSDLPADLWEYPVLDATGIKLASSGSCVIYPNPAKTTIYFKGINDKTYVYLYDINGDLILTKKIAKDDYLNISQLSNGIYILKVKDNSSLKQFKLIKNDR